MLLTFWRLKRVNGTWSIQKVSCLVWWGSTCDWHCINISGLYVGSNDSKNSLVGLISDIHSHSDQSLPSENKGAFKSVEALVASARNELKNRKYHQNLIIIISSLISFIYLIRALPGWRPNSHGIHDKESGRGTFQTNQFRKGNASIVCQE